ncbi:insecticidal delta-endotoxin Cry8Ea1 family protein, partial [Bacillus mycoides]|uniref:insecticidal delta-endotoxin Cry8Ea1 family protein n=1 Tax=Bacillus mycoides TaxID=1405 RepID=UPI0002799884
MNQNYNNNEYEILDAGGMGYQSRYPFAQAPGSEFRQMNYKDWMNMCAGGESGELFAGSNSIRDAIIAGIGISSVILGAAFPVAGAVAGIISIVLPFLWPKEAGTPGTPQAQFTWVQLMNAVEELVNQKIEDLVRGRAIESLQILQSAMRDYQQAICNLKQDPNNEAYKADVRREFNDADDLAKAAIIQFRNEKYALPLLADYAQAANLHLLLLRDVVQYGESWGFSLLEVQQYYSNTSQVGNPGMLQLLATYTDHCARWYNAGLQQQYNTGDWNKFNDYRRDMTLMIMDIVSLWPTYNPRFYPVPTKLQLTRTLYSPTRYTNFVGEDNTIEAFENTLIGPPHLFTWWRGLDLNTQYFQQGGWRFVGFQQQYQYTLDSTVYETSFQGSFGTATTSLEIPSPESKDDVWGITASAVRGTLDTRRFLFYLTESGRQDLFTRPDDSIPLAPYPGFPCRPNTGDDNNPCDPCDPNNVCSTDITNITNPCDEVDLYSHRASRMGAYFAGSTMSRFSFGWTHISADANNLIDAEKITQIPAVKGYYMGRGFTVIKGPGSTGGDLVSFNPSDFPGEYNIRVTAEKAKTYQLRIRYACQESSELTIIRYFGDHAQDWDLGRVYYFPKTYSGGELTYNSFGYLTIPNLLNPGPYYEDTWKMVFRPRGDAEIIIDKIEFIPIEGSVEEYEANQNLEKARKAVNA